MIMIKKKSSTPKLPIKLYIVHGWSYGLNKWQPTIDLLTKRGIKFKFLKVPGLTKPSKKVWSIEDYIVWLNKELKATTQPVILGHSNGGRLLLNYCLRHPDKIRHLILLNSAGVLPTTRQRARNCIFRFLSKALKPLKRIRCAKRLVYRVLGARDYNRAPANMKLTLNNMLESDKNLVKRLKRIQTPVSFIWGDKDKVTPLRHAYFLQSQLPNIKSFEVLEGAQHLPYATHPQILTQAILRVLMNL